MTTTKKLVLAGLTIASISGAGLFTQNVFAQNTQDTTGLASKIAAQFNLNENEVKTVLEQYRVEKQAEREAKFTEQLDKALADGQLTQEQKDKILAKRQELKAAMDAAKASSDKAELKQKMKELRESSKAWAKDNGIDLRWLRASGAELHRQK